MLQPSIYRNIHKKIALVGNHLPRRCGIATFTGDLLAALSQETTDGECWAVVMNDMPEGYRYPSQVRFELNHKTPADYRLAADFLNINQVDIVSLQHEFGIFGGENGVYILDLLNNLRMPVVTTLHTVLREPQPGQISVLKKIAHLSDRLVVMSRKAEDILKEIYGVLPEKIEIVHHGIPDVPFVDPNYYKDQFGVEGRKVILTFGLLSPGKGIENMIEALPRIVKVHSDAVYIVLGATHPHVKKTQGESYRLSLQQKARDLGVSENLIFHNRFVEQEELCEFLGAADIYVTPYLQKEQITSGTLAYALGTGKAVISTPYWYAEEMLAEGRGRLVPFHEPEAMASEVNNLFSQEAERHAMRKKAYTFCREMVWKEVARKYLKIFLDVQRERKNKPCATFRTKTLESTPLEMPLPKLDHLIRLTDDVGILQHAKFIVPDRYHGYCTDDNARALIAVLMAQNMVPDPEKLTDMACIYLSFLHHAFNEDTGRFRNFMNYDRRWLEDEGSEDSHGRAIWGLGEGIALSQSEHITGAALLVFEKAISALLKFTSPRAWAFGLIGIHAYLKKFSGDSGLRRVRESLAERLFGLYQEYSSENWRWIESPLTYANGKIPHALLLSGQWLQRKDILKGGLNMLEWLINIQTDPQGHFVPVGSEGWFKKNGEKARFDQQPIEALSMIEACKEAYNVSNNPQWLSRARCCLEWFLGRNDLNVPLYDYTSGGCCDGLSANGPNHNQGAESTLAWLLSLFNLYQLENSQASAETVICKNNKLERS
ncbi:MAG: glycosyltransferase family 4 protein [Victivallaceae bacterium]